MVKENCLRQVFHQALRHRQPSHSGSSNIGNTNICNVFLHPQLEGSSQCSLFWHALKEMHKHGQYTILHHHLKCMILSRTSDLLVTLTSLTPLGFVFFHGATSYGYKMILQPFLHTSHEFRANDLSLSPIFSHPHSSIHYCFNGFFEWLFKSSNLIQE